MRSPHTTSRVELQESDEDPEEQEEAESPDPTDEKDGRITPQTALDLN